MTTPANPPDSTPLAPTAESVWQVRVAESMQIIQQLKAEQAILVTRQSDLENQLAARQKLNERQRQDIDTIQEQLEQQRLGFAQERRQWEQRQQELQASLLEAQDLSQKRIDMLQRFKAELALARTQISELQAELTQAKTVHAHQESVWREERDHWQARLAGYAETEAEWQQQRQEERETFAEQLQQATVALAAQQAEVVALQEQCQTAITLQAQMAADRATYQEVIATHREQQQRYEDLVATHHQALNQVTTQEILLEQTTHENVRLQHDLTQAQDKLTEQQLHIMRLKAALEKYGAPESEKGLPTANNPDLTPAAKPLAPSLPPRTPGIDLPRFLSRP